MIGSLTVIVVYAGLVHFEAAGGAAQPHSPGMADLLAGIASGADAIAAPATAVGPATTLPPVATEAILAASEPVSHAEDRLQPAVAQLDALAASQRELVDRLRAGGPPDPGDVARGQAMLAETADLTARASSLADAAIAAAEATPNAVADLAVVCNCAAEQAAVAAAKAAVLAAARTLRNLLGALGVATTAATVICAFFFVTPACLAALAAVAAATLAVSFAQDDLLAETAKLRAAEAALVACIVRVRRDPACRPPSGR